MNDACGPYIAACSSRATTAASTISGKLPVSSSAKKTNVQTARRARPTSSTGRRPKRSDSAPKIGMNTTWQAAAISTAFSA